MALTQERKLTAGEARDLHFASLVIDGLEAAPMTAEHFARLRTAGVAAVNYTSASIDHDFGPAALDLMRLRRTIAEHDDQVMLVETAGDIERARREGRVGIIMGLQNARPFMEDLGYVAALYQLGVRIVQLTYNERNLLGDGCVERANGGLSRFGRRAVAEMNRLGMLVDVSHCGERTTLDAIEASSAPVAVTHANAAALTPSPRNKSDAVLAALRDTGGVIGAAFWAPMAFRDPARRPGVTDFLDHVDHLVERAGVDHVAIGTDLGEGESRAYYEGMFLRGGGKYPEVTHMLGDWYDFDHRMVEDLESVVTLPSVTEGLAARGYDAASLRKILGENLLRVLRAAWRA